MRVLVTGADGFVGRHLCRFLEEAGDLVFPVCGNARPDGSAGARAAVVDVRDAQAVQAAVAAARPDAIVHLAAISHVVQSHAEPTATFQINTLGALNVCLAAKVSASRPRVLLVSSGEVYGAVAAGELATEDTPFSPVSPYAASKIAAEMIGSQFARSYGMPVVRARPFNHLGAGQASTFAIPSLARQVNEARKSASRATIWVGDLDPVRDFSHVRDVVAAYRLLLERGVSGEVYNVCSGKERTIRSVLDELVELAKVSVDVKVDPSKLRAADIPRLVGSAAKLRALGWEPRLTVRDALQDLLDEPAPRRDRSEQRAID
jgi:GDP-4-dehydro-6-deoxy-D-mannose reductase